MVGNGSGAGGIGSRRAAFPRCFLDVGTAVHPSDETSEEEVDDCEAIDGSVWCRECRLLIRSGDVLLGVWTEWESGQVADG
jgi:hypothetical protein